MKRPWKLPDARKPLYQTLATFQPGKNLQAEFVIRDYSTVVFPTQNLQKGAKEPVMIFRLRDVIQELWTIW